MPGLGLHQGERAVGVRGSAANSWSGAPLWCSIASACARLRPVAGATSVRVRQGETLVSDGPFAETKDFVGGFAVVECADLDEAIAIAAGHPWAHRGVVEIRPVWEDC